MDRELVLINQPSCNRVTGVAISQKALSLRHLRYGRLSLGFPLVIAEAWNGLPSAFQAVGAE